MITLYVNNGVAYVWNSEDWYILRSKHRICGSLIGSVASFPRQNDFNGLPMALMSEEAALLVNNNICELVELPQLCDKPSESVKKEFTECEQRVKEEQTEDLRKRKIEQMKQKIHLIVAGKKQKLAAKGITDVELDHQTLLQEEIDKLPKVAAAHLLVHLPTEHFISTDKKHVSLDMLKPSVVDVEGALRCSVFSDLWRKGHYITSGSKFGCDYLVYPGDPVRFHASYMVRCIHDHQTAFRPANIVAFGRLSVAVNKMAVFAFCTSNGNVDYQTLQWHDNVVNG
ncbi:tRNA-splicing endonuclease subunit Sen34 [Ostrinia furnacalis]|uniref:tRNA-splicing endonuclease subunit Sen34 n=1 Tax=Ostrinia furnacalis TaxID=93504 RepID=UPI00103F25BC|nr:tRNA-splicing endonuclease subunit Sen34 [Ostrinia furnacalis]